MFILREPKNIQGSLGNSCRLLLGINGLVSLCKTEAIFCSFGIFPRTDRFQVRSRRKRSGVKCRKKATKCRKKS